MKNTVGLFVDVFFQLTEDMTAKVGDLGLSTILSKIKIRSYGAGSVRTLSFAFFFR